MGFGHVAVILVRSDGNGIYYSFQSKNSTGIWTAIIGSGKAVEGSVDKQYLTSDEMKNFRPGGSGILPSGRPYTRYISISVDRDLGNVMFKTAEILRSVQRMYDLYAYNCNYFVQEILGAARISFDQLGSPIPNSAYNRGVLRWEGYDGYLVGSYANITITFGDLLNRIQSEEPSTSQSRPSIETSEGVTESITQIPSPSTPALLSPYNWYQSLGTSPNLIWSGDENTSSYYVIVSSSDTGNIESGWVDDNSWIPDLPNENYIYSWKVKARNVDGIESSWSDKRYFSIASTTLRFEGDISFIPSSPSSANEIIILASTTGWGGVGVTLRVSVNTFPDGSSSGEWKILKELGVPKFTEDDAPRWSTTDWSDGTYRVRVEAKGPNDPNWLNSTVVETTYTLVGKEDSVVEVDTIETIDDENKEDSSNLSEVKNLVIYKSYDSEEKKNVFTIMNTNGTNKKMIYLDNFLVKYSKLPFNLNNADSPFLSSDGRYIICNERGTWVTHLLDTKENLLKTLQYLNEDNELDTGSIRRDPCFSPGGETIVVGGFHSSYTDFSVQLCTLLTIEIENAKPKILTDLNSWVNDPRYSKDGSKIIFNNDKSEIIIVNSDGSGFFNFTETYGYKGEHPAFSPDGNTIVFSYPDIISKIATVDIDGGNFNIIYKSENGDCESPSYSSYGNRIVFCAPHGDPTGHYRDIFSIDIKGENLINLTNSAKIDDNEPECTY